MFINRFWALPEFKKDEEKRNAHVLQPVLLLSFIATTVFIIEGVWLANFGIFLTSFSFLLVTLLSWVLARRGKLRVVNFLLPIALLSVLTYRLYTSNGIHDRVVILYPLVIVFAALLLGRRATATFLVLSIATVWSAIYLEMIDVIVVVPTQINADVSDMLVVAIGFTATALVANIINDINHRFAQLWAHQQALQQNNEELMRQIAERQRVERQLQDSLREKEMLLKEVHHRVKNNMQIVVSMLNLQSAQVNDSTILDVLRDSQNRVRSMALVHEKLYQSDNLAQIDCQDYLHHLTSALFHSYGSRLSPIRLEIEANDIALGVDSAIPCGLIVNEIVSNALKHAFPNAQRGTVIVRLCRREGDSLELSIEDDGLGFPVEKDFRNTDSLGMQLVLSLVRQLNGSIELIRLQPGSRFVIRFTSGH